ncbi:thioredoxin family protein [Deinococcus planocerae]|uniref:thioredoxin family protein n=1 Tax=Deinococcus planocerae TaxID=1737569 RepID=UPI000C7EBA0B|nr:thioredoxin family protein [Deinococcus planocerae]
MNKFHLSALAAALLATAFAAAPSSNTMTGHSMTGDSMMKTTAYQPYSKAAFDAAKGMRRVLFFHATWCPNCKAADADLTKNLAGLPRNVVVFKTDYDRETALKRQYGITSQHTFVLVDAGGRALTKWSGGGVREIVAKTGMVR